jgi:hypothetical protein
MRVKDEKPSYQPVIFHTLMSHQEKRYHAVLARDDRAVSRRRSLCGLEGLEPFDHTRPAYSTCRECSQLLPEDRVCVGLPRGAAGPEPGSSDRTRQWAGGMSGWSGGRIVRSTRRSAVV